MVVQKVLTATLIILIIVAGVVGYFIGSMSAAPAQVATPTSAPPKTVTVTVTPSTQVYKLTLAAHLVSSEYRYQEFTLKFISLVKNMSDGRLIITPYPAGSIGPVSEIPSMVAKGTVDLGEIFPGYYTSVDPLFDLLGAIPGPISSASDLWYLYHQFEPELKKICEKKLGVVYVGLYIGQVPIRILFFRSPIHSLKEMNGKIFRCIGLDAAFFGALGAKTVALSGGDLYSALQLGTIDGTEWGGYLSSYGLKLYEVAPYILEDKEEPFRSAVGVFLAANPKTWGELPDDLKEIIRTAAKYVFFSSYSRMYYEDLEYKKIYIAKGAKITELPSDEHSLVKEVGAKVVAEHFKGYPDLLKEYINILRGLGYDDWANMLESYLKG
jgi:TRAP-type mannitol/chloroaromatic compound transport system substrate-binding protein